MVNYTVKILLTGQEEKFRSIPEIVKKFGQIKGITVYNLRYHFSQCKKDEVFIVGVHIIKSIIK